MKTLKELMLGPPSQTVACAESMSAGHLQARIAAAPGASAFFLGGITTYNLDQKSKLLGIDLSHARGVNCVSERVAREMAQGACKLFGADFGISTTGYAEAHTELGIRAPMAWWAVFHQIPEKDPVVFSRKVELPDFKRVAAQAEVAAIALIAFTEYVQSLAKR